MEFDHAYLQLGAAVQGLGVTLASLPLIQQDLAAGRLVCPLAAPTWRAPDYALVINADRASDAAVAAFGRWILAVGSEDAPAAGPD